MLKKLQPHQRMLIGFIVVGLLLILIPFIYYTPDYDELSTKDIVVQDVDYVSSRGGRSYYLTTIDGERLEIRGELSYSELKEVLTPNTRVTIKYYHGLHGLRMTDYIRELAYNGNPLVAYSGDCHLNHVIAFFVIGLIVVLIGFLLYILEAHMIKKSSIKKAARKERLKKKYGDKYRDIDNKRSK